jgi:hypothetical protein
MRDGKKLPIDYRTASVADAHNPAAWMSADVALQTLTLYGDGFGLGFVFTSADPFFFVDIDKCLQPDNTTWSPVAMDLLARLPGAAVEVSQSGRGLHIFGVGSIAEHGCKNIPLGIELYTEGRFVALTGTNAIGSADTDCNGALAGLVRDYFAQRSSGAPSDWTTTAVPEYTGPSEDDELIAKALASSSAGSIFGGRATFADLWNADEDRLAAAYPPNDPGVQVYDASSADAALAQHLAFWTGKNCERIDRLMKRSALVRDKWEREDYLHRTITGAVGKQTTVYSVASVDNTLADEYGAVKLRAASDAQRAYGERVRAAKLAEAAADPELVKCLARISAARTWIDNETKTPQEIAAMVTPVAAAACPLGESTGPTVVSGYQYLAADQQIEHFKGCVYIQDAHRIFTPTGALLKPDQFNATYGGYIFQLDGSGDKITRKAWEAFTESQVVRYPKAETTCFRPDIASGEIIVNEGKTSVNTYLPVETERQHGDLTPFLTHLAKVLPVKRDQDILLAYMAAVVQYKGVKFQWAPLLQGAEGNGKTLFTRCLRFAIGRKHYHSPKAAELGGKFNGWLSGKIFIGVEDIFVAEHRAEVLEALKPMITGEDLEIERKGIDSDMSDICANFLFNSNYKDALRGHVGGRRYAIFFTAQQNEDDLTRDGMTGDYFPKLYAWLRNGGYAIVNEYLTTYPIPDELNPADRCHRAPETSSTREAISASRGGIEQDILEAIEEGRVGFAGGWVSSVALDRLLQHSRSARAIPHNRRREIMRELGYDWHPALPNGRVNNPIALDDNKKPRLYIKRGHVNVNIVHVIDVVKAYTDAQNVAATGDARAVFSA